MTPSRCTSGIQKRAMEFLFPPETDKWLAALRIGLGLQVGIYALFLRSDWHFLFASTGKGLVSRELGEAITSFDSPFIPKLGWLVALGSYVHIGEDAVLSVAWACLLCMGLLLLVNLISPDILVRFKYALPILGISICLIELGYPFFIWLRKTRLFWLICILAMHVAIGLAMGMYLFALVMIVLNLAAFGIGISKQRPVASEVTADGRKHRATHRYFRAISPRHFTAWRLNSTDAKAHVANRPAAETLF